MNDKSELLPCPFCGNSNVTEDEGCFPVGGRWEVRCGNPNCFASDSTDITQQAAIARWNRRAPKPEAQVAGVGALPAKWRSDKEDDAHSTSLWDQGFAHARNECADELQAALSTPASHDAQQPAVVGDGVRDAFEQWVAKRHGCALDRWADSGKYRYDNTNAWWECWQAALTPAATPGDADLGAWARRQMQESGPIKTVSGKDVYGLMLPPVGRDAGLDAAIAAALAQKEGNGNG